VSHDYLLWVATAAYAIHILEEHELDWRDWARNVLKLPVEWPSFYLVNGLVLVLGICCAGAGWRQPVLALAFPAVMLINATLFHVLPVLVTRVFSPGVITAVILFYPIGCWVWYGAWLDGVLSVEVGVAAGVLGAVLMACPVVLLKVKHLRLFQYAETDRRHV
jgi:hypothetical protein